MALPRQRRGPRIASWPTPEWDRVHWSYRGLKFFLEAPLKKTIPIRWKGLEHVPRAGGVVLAPNHLSYADPIVLGAVMERPMFFLAMEKLFDAPGMRWLVDRTGQIRVDRAKGGNEEAVRRAAELARAGHAVAIFPEGHRRRPGEELRWRSGAARVALEAGAPLVPVAMTTERFFPKHSKVPRFGEPVYINIGRPLPKPEGAADDREAARALTDDLVRRISELFEEADEARRSGDTWRAERDSGTR